MRTPTDTLLAQQVGQLIFFGFDGYEVNHHARRAIRELHLGNVILFSRNYRDPGQFSELIRSLQREAMEANGVPLLVALDQEGGSVTRLGAGMTHFPGPMATRAAGGPELARRVGAGIGAEMAALGANFCLAPLVDLANDPDSSHVGSRSYGACPACIAPYAAAFLAGVQGHVPAAAKHFPSIGGSHVDLHLQLGRNEHSLQQLEACEMAPVRAAVAAGVAAVMTSHEVYPAVEECPGTLSRRLITGQLREKYGFGGLVVSDCMEMQALADQLPTPEGCVRAVLAGVDLLLICHTEAIQAASAAALFDAVRAGRIPTALLEQALGRIRHAKKALAAPPASFPPAGFRDLLARDAALADAVCARALTVQGSARFFACGPRERFLFLAPPPAALTMADERGGSEGLAAQVQRAFPCADCIEYPFPLGGSSLEALCRRFAAGGYSKVLAATYNAHTDPGQRELLRLALGSGMPVGAIALRSPYDARWYGGAAARAFLYEYTPPMAVALLRLLQGALTPKGLLPPDVQAVLEPGGGMLSWQKR